MPVSGAMEVELWLCEYPTPCSARGCKAPADTLVRHLDEQGGLINQVALCREHVRKTILGSGSLKVRDRRHAA